MGETFDKEQYGIREHQPYESVNNLEPKSNSIRNCTEIELLCLSFTFVGSIHPIFNIRLISAWLLAWFVKINVNSQTI